ncbi:aminoglycoside phosphotransferase family protein [Halomonas llamarensis]|uniref:Phosphotransferase n=1 Tax=Halomonas llamarensis TaxID=2945104 RepID=A0ABT0SNV3_9GAMM|nr:phosphotransferase [Halomonas llamarensis]MCL7929478.1 phosphotransferase [Halomonas llamarensis]
MSSSRINALLTWAATQHGLAHSDIHLAPAGGDASFRRYFRLTLPGGETQVVMDAPLDQEDSTPFVSIARQWRAAGLPVPRVHAADLNAGFLLLDDLGETPLQTLFTDADAVHAHTRDALALIGPLQNRANPAALPAFNAALLGRELDLFPEWHLRAWLDLPVPESWRALRTALIQQALSQPVVTVHRDFDAMNLMPHQGQLYMIDFQDAVAGPLSYDAISLLRGRYWRFSQREFDGFMVEFYQQARDDGRLSSTTDKATFLRQSHAMAAQRSLKVLGIFCRLTLRDGKRGYLEHLPDFLMHLEDSLAALPEHADFAQWLSQTLRPAMTQKLTTLDAQERPE